MSKSGRGVEGVRVQTVEGGARPKGGVRVQKGRRCASKREGGGVRVQKGGRRSARPKGIDARPKGWGSRLKGREVRVRKGRGVCARPKGGVRVQEGGVGCARPRRGGGRGGARPQWGLVRVQEASSQNCAEFNSQNRSGGVTMRQLEGDYDERVVAKSKPVRNLVSRSHASLEKNGATCCQDSHKDLRKSDAMTNSRESFGFQIENQHGIVHDMGKIQSMYLSPKDKPLVS